MKKKWGQQSLPNLAIFKSTFMTPKAFTKTTKKWAVITCTTVMPKLWAAMLLLVSSRLSSQPYLLSDFEKNAWYIDFSLSLFWQQANIQVCTDVWTKFIQDASVWSDPLNIFHALFLISKFIKMNSLATKVFVWGHSLSNHVSFEKWSVY